ncbi:MAG TPA: APC family permease [Candidatus Limnocylindria bacterium]|nr:APC family permease [Candidatus Limnocylindria bacterium]
MNLGPKQLKGRKLGDRRVRIERPHSAYFRYTGEGTLVAKEAASVPRTPAGRLYARVRGTLFGRPLSSHEEITERLSKAKALAIFSSDAISSSAYATEEILRVLILAGAAALFLSLPIAIGIALLLTVVSISYRQEIHAYPSGGGDYAVARRNLPNIFALIVAGALLVDYTMTVAVSTSSAVEQVISAVPDLEALRVEIAVVGIVLIMIGNLRGLRESGNIFAIPTYLFAGSTLLMIAIGIFRIVVLGDTSPPPQPTPGEPDAIQAIGIVLIIRAFASGSVALTGTEAIANGVPAFKRPEPKNAATTLTVMAVLLGILFVGITFVADSFGVVPIDEPATKTVISQVAAHIYGDNTILFYLYQAFTALILFLAANTSFNAFPRLAAILATDGYMPRQFSFKGDRLAFTSGIVILSIAASVLIILFGGITTALIPLYAVGVFIAFTIGQTGMVLHWRRERPPGWVRGLAINAFGAVLTGSVFVVVLLAKAPTSLLVAVIIPVLVGMMLFIQRQYKASKAELAVRPDAVIRGPHREERVIVPVPGINRAVVQAINVGRSIDPNVQAVLISEDPEEATAIKQQWERQLPDVPLVIVESPYRALVAPLISYLDVLDRAWPSDKEHPITFVVVPEYVAKSWWERILYNQSAKRLRQALLGRPHTVVVNVPYRREASDTADKPPDAKPTDAKPTDAKPTDAKPTDAKPTDDEPTDQTPRA